MVLLSLLEALFIAAALQWTPSAMLIRADYESALDYALAQMASFLGSYSLVFLLEALLAFVLILWMREKELWEERSGWPLPIFFGFCLLLGESYRALGDWTGCFGGIVNLLRFVIALAGYTLLFRRVIALFWHGYGRLADSDWDPPVLRKLFGKNCFRNVWILLLAVWAPVILIAFPGNVSYDAYGQISQVLGTMPYSAHHPMFHTLIMGGLVKLFYPLTGGYEAGVFLYVICQALALGAVLAYSIAWLKKENRSACLLTVILGIYLLAPMYSNYVSTAVKDIPYAAAVVWYVILLAQGVMHPEKRGETKYLALLTLAALLCALLRNNGIYLVLPTGIVTAFAWRGKQPEREETATGGEKKARRRTAVYFAVLVLLPLALYLLCNTLLCKAVDARAGSKGEMLSLPFQQTARALSEHGDELTVKERTAIELVLGDTSEIPAKYDPDSADPVKALYRQEAAGGDILRYLGVWAKLFFRYPASYLEAFFHHVYGLFDPAVPNSIRYEIYEEDFFVRRGLFENADKVLIFLYRFADRISLLSLLQNAGVYVWAMFLLCARMRKGQKSALILMLPLFMSLLICMAAPCFFNHVRYAFPILFTLPFLYGVMAGGERGIHTSVR